MLYQLNRTNLLGENVKNVPKYWDILAFARISKIGPHFGRFSGHHDRIELIPFALFQYQHCIV
jgi:hypothetical protein